MLPEDIQLMCRWVPWTCRPKTPLSIDRQETTKVTLTFLLLLLLASMWRGWVLPHRCTELTMSSKFGHSGNRGSGRRPERFKTWFFTNFSLKIGKLYGIENGFWELVPPIKHCTRKSSKWFSITLDSQGIWLAGTVLQLFCVLWRGTEEAFPPRSREMFLCWITQHRVRVNLSALLQVVEDQIYFQMIYITLAPSTFCEIRETRLPRKTSVQDLVNFKTNLDG